MYRKGSAAAAMMSLMTLSKLFGCSVSTLNLRLSLFQIFYSIFFVFLITFFTICTFVHKDVDDLSISTMNTVEVDFQYTVMTVVAVFCIVRYPRRRRFLRSVLERVDRYDRFLNKIGVVIEYNPKLECCKAVASFLYILGAILFEGLIYGYFLDFDKIPQTVLFFDQGVICATELEFLFLVKVLGKHLHALRSEGESLYELLGSKFLMLQHTRLRGISKEINHYYGSEVLFCMFRLFAMAATTTHFAIFYFIFKLDFKSQMADQVSVIVLFLSYTLFYLWELFEICNVCYWTETENDRFNDSFGNLVAWGRSNCALYDEDIRTHLALRHKIEFDCNGYVHLTNSLFLSVVGALVTYLGFFIQKQITTLLITPEA